MADPYERLRSLPILDVLLALGWDASAFRVRKQGTEFFGACPVCQPKKNKGNFSFDTSGKFNCFSCPAKGRGSLDLTMLVKSCGFKEAVSFLEDLPIRPQPPTVTSCNITATASLSAPITENAPFKGTYEKFAVESSWLKERGLTPETLARYEVFQYHNPARRSVYSGSVMLKIRRWCDRECVGYLSRNIGEVTPEKPKYVFPKGVQKSLEVFGAWQLKEKRPIRVLYLLESPFAVMAFHQRGLPAVSPFGFSVSAEQVAIIAQLARGVVYLPDRNKRDQISGYIEALSRHVWVKAHVLPATITDPENLTPDQIQELT